MKKPVIRALPFLITCCLVTTARTATPDPVVVWNGIAANAFAAAIAAGRPGQVGALDLAMVHAAIHDAVQGFEHRFQPYHFHPAAAASGSVTAAVAKAAHDVLVNLYPAQTSGLDTAYTNYLSANQIPSNDPGVFVGQMAAADIIALRTNDGRFPPLDPRPCGPGVGVNCIFRGGTAPGDWRPTESFNAGPPPSNAPMAVVWLGSVVPFTMTSTDQFRADPHPALTSPEYTRAFNEVKTFGSLTSAARTPEQTDLAIFYSDNFILLLNRAVSRIAAEHLQSTGDIARLFALVYLAMADSGITAWDSKKFYNFWRPVTGVREGDNDTNPRTAGDPNWKPFLNTPNYPDYTSGANNVTASAMTMLSLFFHRDRMTFTVDSNAPAQMKVRTYTRFSDVKRDVVDVRVLQGIHFRFADEAARRQGTQIARWTFTHVLRPLTGGDDDDDGADDDRDR